MERELGISYPTVRSRVEALVRALGFGPRADADEATDDAATGVAAGAGAGAAVGAAAGPTDAATHRQTILERLAKREITADEAAAAIRSLGRTDR
jgi:hypothetical protein